MKIAIDTQGGGSTSKNNLLFFWTIYYLIAINFVQETAVWFLSFSLYLSVFLFFLLTFSLCCVSTGFLHSSVFSHLLPINSDSRIPQKTLIKNYVFLMRLNGETFSKVSHCALQFTSTRR